MVNMEREMKMRTLLKRKKRLRVTCACVRGREGSSSWCAALCTLRPLSREDGMKCWLKTNANSFRASLSKQSPLHRSFVKQTYATICSCANPFFDTQPGWRMQIAQNLFKNNETCPEKKNYFSVSYFYGNPILLKGMMCKTIFFSYIVTKGCLLYICYFLQWLSIKTANYC